jgi:hypothetical protein
MSVSRVQNPWSGGAGFERSNLRKRKRAQSLTNTLEASYRQIQFEFVLTE